MLASQEVQARIPQPTCREWLAAVRALGGADPVIEREADGGLIVRVMEEIDG